VDAQGAWCLGARLGDFCDCASDDFSLNTNLPYDLLAVCENRPSFVDRVGQIYVQQKERYFFDN
jgi:hypothetical protein